MLEICNKPRTQCRETQAMIVLKNRQTANYYCSHIYRILVLPTEHCFLWSPLCNRADHYIFALWFLSSFFFLFFPRLISAVGDWMSTILPHMVWPWCEFRMHVWNVLHAARWKYSTQKNHYFGTIAQVCRAVSSQLRHVSTIGKKLVKQRYLSHVLIIWWTSAS